jgi:hypothetical protein
MQKRFRRALVAARGGVVACDVCGSTTDVRACHVVAVSAGGSYDASNGRLLCGPHDRATDRYAR